MKALIVEDVPESQDLLCEIATAAFPGIVCVCVAEVRPALALLGTPFRLALVDLSLPDGTGLDVLRQLVPRQPECTVVVATIHDDDEHVFSALRAGAHGYLHKDEPPDRLVAQLQGIREGRPPLSPAIARRILGYFHQPQPVPAAEPTIDLTPREREVLSLLGRGLSIAVIARELAISPYTVGDHVKNIYRKLDITSRAEAALQARDLGLL